MEDNKGTLMGKKRNKKKTEEEREPEKERGKARESVHGGCGHHSVPGLLSALSLNRSLSNIFNAKGDSKNRTPVPAGASRVKRDEPTLSVCTGLRSLSFSVGNNS